MRRQDKRLINFRKKFNRIISMLNRYVWSVIRVPMLVCNAVRLL